MEEKPNTQAMTAPLVPPTPANPTTPVVVQEPGRLRVVVALQRMLAAYFGCVCFGLLIDIGWMLIDSHYRIWRDHGYVMTLEILALLYHAMALMIYVRLAHGLMLRQKWTLRRITLLTGVNGLLQVTFPVIVWLLGYVFIPMPYTGSFTYAFSIHADEVAWYGIIPFVVYIILSAISIAQLKRLGVRVLFEEPV
jgi:hypothetical protein